MVGGVCMRAWSTACLLLIAAGAAQAVNCPGLFLGVRTTATENVVKGCTGSAGCNACQCSLVAAITPKLVQSGKILASEAWMPSSLNIIADVLTQCKKDFALQLLENTNTSLTQYAGLDSCATDVKMVSQCISQITAPAANITATAPAPTPATSPGTSMADEVLTEACAASLSGTSNATSCPSPAAARMVAGLPFSSGSGMMVAPATRSDGSVLEISGTNTRGPITWRAMCWCDDVWDPVCDVLTRKQYPNSCSAGCQNVTQVVPCSSLEPLVNQTLAGNTAVFVVDQSLMRAAAFAGPVPAEAPEDSQMFYYYYEDDADDTQDAMDIASTLAEAFLAAKLGDEVDAVDAMNKVLPRAMQAGATPLKPNVTKADGPTQSSGISGMLASLRNITVIRQRIGLDRRAQSPPVRRNITLAPVAGSQPPNPTWMMTSAPGYKAGVYQRDPQRTSRILASLMAAAQDAKNKTRAAGVVVNITPAMGDVVKAAAGALQGAGQGSTGGMFRSASVGTAPALATVREAVSNFTGSTNGTLGAALNGTRFGNMTRVGNMTAGNTTANGTAAGPIIQAFEGLMHHPGAAVANSRFGKLVEELSGVVQGTGAKPVTGLQQQAAAMLRSALNAASKTNTGTGASSMQASSQQKLGTGNKRRLLFV